MTRWQTSALLLLASALLPAAVAYAYMAGPMRSRRATFLASSTAVESPPTAKLTTGKLPWRPEGYSRWDWRTKTGTYKVNFVDFDEESSSGSRGQSNKPPLLLIHGFGASVYHWRYNIPALSKDFRVFAIDLLGFGLSEKPIVDYNAEVWRDQVLAFIEEIISQRTARPCVVAGNSLGGFTALYAAASPEATSKNLINGCVLLNAAGAFRDQQGPPQPPDAEWLATLKKAFQRFVIGLSFIYTKQPARIEQVLRQVYPINADQVDKELVESIQFPAQDPNAPEVFYRVIVKNGNGPPKLVDDLLEVLKVPLLLLWGQSDPWIRPQAADKMQVLFPSAQRVNVNAGHCPHDEAPGPVNDAISAFAKQVNAVM